VITLKKSICLLLACALLFSSCSFLSNTQNVEELLSPPKITQIQAEIVRALEEHEGGNIHLQAPINGDNIFPIYMEDINGDDVQEAIVFYVVPQKGTNVRLAVLEQTQNGYVVVGEEEGVSSEIESFTLASFYTGNNRQLVVGYQNLNLNEHYMVVYNCLNEEGSISLSRIHEQAYSNFLVCDMTGEGAQDLVIISSPRANTSGSITVNLLSVTQTGLESIAFHTLNNRLRRCENMYQSVGMGNESFVVMDCSRGVTTTAGVVSSVAVYYDDGILQEYELLAGEDFIAVTTRTAGILRSIDLDEDGAIEIPVVIGAYNGAPNDMRFLAVEWYDLFVSSDEADYFGILDAEYGFFLKLPLVFKDTTEVIYNEENGNFAIIDVETSDILFEVAFLAKGESFTVTDEITYTQVALSGGYRVYIRIVALPPEVDAGTLFSGFVVLR
jgi:hypothetical protein